MYNKNDKIKFKPDCVGEVEFDNDSMTIIYYHKYHGDLKLIYFLSKSIDLFNPDLIYVDDYLGEYSGYIDKTCEDY